MNITAIFCCYILLPYFASIVSPPQEVITCTAANGNYYQPNPFLIVNEDNGGLTPEWFTQKLDHFHQSDKTKFPQKFYVNAAHYEGVGPVFFLIGGRGEIDPKLIQEGRWNDYAQRAKALLIILEHRFFGESIPPRGLFKEYYVYLSTEQVLADAALFIYKFPRITNYTVPETAKWIAIGVSHGGSLATWMRMKYPHLVHGTLSLSAPLVAKVNFSEFYEGIERDMLDKEQMFKSQLVEAYTAIDKLTIGYDRRKLATLGFKLTQCLDSMLAFGNKTKNVQQMYFIFANLLSRILQHSNDTFKSEYQTFYDKMTKISSYKPMDRFINAVFNVSRDRYGQSCFSGSYNLNMQFYSNYLTLKGDLNFQFPYQSLLGKRHFIYQSCTEFGQFQTSENAERFFGNKIPLEFFVDICTALFGEENNLEFLKKAVLRTNTIYGGLNNKLSNAIFVYGDLDPWKKLGMTSPKTKDNISVFLIKGAKHCDNLDNIGKIEEEIYNKLVDLLKLS